MFRSDYPRSLAKGFCLWWFPAFDALPVAPALAIAFLLARRRFPVSSLGLPPQPLPRLFPAALAAIPLARLLRMKALLTAFEQTTPRPTGRLPPLGPLLLGQFGRDCYDC